jgi:hypothetical protein
MRRYPLTQRTLWEFIAVCIFECILFCLNGGLTALSHLFSWNWISFFPFEKDS